jgi:hypothetical protein
LTGTKQEHIIDQPNQEEMALSLIDRTYRLQSGVAGLGLECTVGGVSLAGAPLLRATPAGLAPRPMEELGVLLKAAYGRPIDPAGVSPGLRVIAGALNEGGLGRAMVAAVHLKLPAVSPEGADRIAKADGALAKYDANEPRDERGRWTADGGGSGGAQRILVANGPRPPKAANDNFSPRPPREPDTPEDICLLASKQCQLVALGDKSRTPFLGACLEGHDACLKVLGVSRLDPEQRFAFKYPDNTVLDIVAGQVRITHISGVRVAPNMW